MLREARLIFPVRGGELTPALGGASAALTRDYCKREKLQAAFPSLEKVDFKGIVDNRVLVRMKKSVTVL